MPRPRVRVTYQRSLGAITDRDLTAKVPVPMSGELLLLEVGYPLMVGLPQDKTLKTSPVVSVEAGLTLAEVITKHSVYRVRFLEGTMAETTTDKNFPPPTLGQRALAIAVSKIGQAEVGGQNKGPIVDWSITPWTHAEAGEWARWCAAFVSTCVLRAATPDQAIWWSKIGTTSATTLWKRCLASGWARKSLKLAAPGDIVFFTHGGDPSAVRGLRHVGLIEQIDAKEVHTVEGNAGDAVRRRVYPLSDPLIYGSAKVPG
jgi:hypothetical protein